MKKRAKLIWTACFAMPILAFIEGTLCVSASYAREATPENCPIIVDSSEMTAAEQVPLVPQIKSSAPCHLQSFVAKGPVKIEESAKKELDSYLIKAQHGSVKAIYEPLGSLPDENYGSCHVIWVSLLNSAPRDLPYCGMARVKTSPVFQTDITLDLCADIYRNPESFLQNIPEPMASDILKRAGQSYPTTGSVVEMVDWLNRNQIDGNVPDEKDFDRLMSECLDKYFTEMDRNPAEVHFTLLRKKPAQIGVAFPKFYLWIRATNKASGQLVHIGGLSVSAMFKKEFFVRYFYSAGQIADEPISIFGSFTPNLQPVVFDLAKQCTEEEKALP